MVPLTSQSLPTSSGSIYTIQSAQIMCADVLFGPMVFYFILISFVFVTSATTSLPCQQCHQPLPTHSLYYPAPPASFKWPKKCAGHVVWAYGDFFFHFLC